MMSYQELNAYVWAFFRSDMLLVFAAFTALALLFIYRQAIIRALLNGARHQSTRRIYTALVPDKAHPIFTVFMVLLFGVLVYASYRVLPTLFTMFDVLARDLGDPKADDTDYRLKAIAFFGVLTALAAFVGFAFSFVRAFSIERNTIATEQGHVTERITRAVEQLGAEKEVKRLVDDKPINVTEPNLEVRIGGLYALERIAQDSQRDHIPIMETICAYVRGNALKYLDEDATAAAIAQAVEDGDIEPDASADERARFEVHLPLRADLQTALTILGRRDAKSPGCLKREQAEGYRLDLRDSWLRGVDLIGATLGAVMFDGAHLEGARLDGAHLEGARLDGAHLEGARLNGAHLERAWLDGAHLERAWLTGAHLERAWLDGAHLEGAWLNEAHLEGARLNRAHLEGAWLNEAHLEGARLMGAHLDSVTDFTASICQNLAVKSVDFTDVTTLTQDQVNQMVGDGSTTPPEGLDRPGSDTWHPDDLSWEAFTEFRDARRAAGT